MCGIAGVILKQQSNLHVRDTVLLMSKAIKHRGPDGEGLIAITTQDVLPLRTSDTPAANTNCADATTALLDNVLAVLAHRRLSIIDLSPLGHQPMCSIDESVWITYNGELYNYIELKAELILLGCHFVSQTDTEVVINAYQMWGEACVDRFNGMWAFCLYDKAKKIFFASRDRLGVKPFYYINNTNHFAFASEQKAFVQANLITKTANSEALHSYLLNDEIDTSTLNFFEGVNELMPGHNAVYSLQDNRLTVYEYFNKRSLVSSVNNDLSDGELIAMIRERLYEAIRIRLRGDVKMGACLSGGVDSSVVAGIMASFIKEPIANFTAIFPDYAFDEAKYASLVSNHIGGINYSVSPTAEGFAAHVDTLVYALDSPIFNASTFAQFSVMKKVQEQNIKVVLDGQGADELFGGYAHHFFSVWKQDFHNNHFLAGAKAIFQSSKSIPNPALFFVKERLKETLSLKLNSSQSLIGEGFIASYAQSHVSYKNNLNEQLLEDMGAKRLKFYLRCEDRCSMWHSVESRTPFSDDLPLMQLLFSFDGKRKIQHGISKFLLREASQSILPEAIYTRYDKIGFDTPTAQWVSQLKAPIVSEIASANFDFVNKKQLADLSKHSTGKELQQLFKLYALAKWQSV
jgi:asparagine synthase (glutamine-hydrolysing)